MIGSTSWARRWSVGNWLKIVWLCGIFSVASVHAQGMDEVLEEIWADSTENDSYKHLEEGYYDSIATAIPFAGEVGLSFEEMLAKYQTEEFAYSESITTKLSFLERLRKRFWQFMEAIFPKQSLFSEEDFYTLLAVLGLAFVLYLCYHFFVGKNKIYTHIQKERSEPEEVAFVERNLMDVDVRKYIAEAVKNQDYALAIRYQQLLNIQLLNKRGLIEWNYTKTNAELMEDVKDSVLRQEFLACAALFDRIWFGDFAVNATEYQGIAVEFEQFQKSWS